MKLTHDDERFIERETHRDRYLDDLSGMTIFAIGGAKSALSVRNAASRKTRMPERVITKF